MDNRPLLAESGPSKQWISSILNVRFREKRTLSLRLPKLNRKTSALPSEADIISASVIRLRGGLGALWVTQQSQFGQTVGTE